MFSGGDDIQKKFKTIDEVEKRIINFKFKICKNS
jgi:hypothetical protein